LAVNPLYWEICGQFIEVGRLVRVDSRSVFYVGRDQSNAFGLCARDVCQRAPATLTHYDNALTLTRLVDLLAAILAVFPLIGRLNVTSKISTIYLNAARQCASVAGQLYGFACLVQQNERGFVVNAQIARQLQRAVTLGPIYKDRNRCQNIADCQFAAVKDGAGCDAVLLGAAFVLINLTGFEVIGLAATALRTIRLAIGLSVTLRGLRRQTRAKSSQVKAFLRVVRGENAVTYHIQ